MSLIFIDEINIFTLRNLRGRWNPSSLVFTDADADGFDDFAPPPPVNIIHPKPPINLASKNSKILYLGIIAQNAIQLMTVFIVIYDTVVVGFF